MTDKQGELYVFFRAQYLSLDLLEALRELVTFCQESTPPDFHDPARYPEMYAALANAERLILEADTGVKEPRLAEWQEVQR